MRFSTRVLLSLVGLSTVGLVLTGLLMAEARSEAVADSRLSSTIAPALRTAERVGRRYVNMQNNVRGYLLTGDDSFMDEVNRLSDAVDVDLDELRTQTAGVVDGSDARIDAIRAAMDGWWNEAVRVELDLKRAGRDRELVAFIRDGTPTELFSTLLTRWSEIREAIDDELTSVRLRRSEALRDLAMFGVLLVSSGGLAAAFIVVWLRRSMVRPVRSLVVASRRLLDGDRDTTVPDVDVAEFAPLAAALEALRRSIDEAVESRARAAVQVELDGELARVADELHDDPIQAMTAALMHVHRLGRLVEPEHRAAVEVAESAVSHAVQRLRRFTFSVHPTLLATDGLRASLESLARLESDEGSTPSVNIDGDVPVDLPPEVSLVAFRVAREALSNAMRHSGAERIAITIAMGAGGLSLSIIDDGCGFDVEVARPLHRGVDGMRRLARVAGGTLQIHSSPSIGTSVQLLLPPGHPTIDLRSDPASLAGLVD